MTNALGPATGQQSGAVTYSFGYDRLYRLTEASGTALSRPGVIDAFQSHFDYDDIHNMTSNRQVHAISSANGAAQGEARPPQSNHDWMYSYDPVRSHQATRIGDTLLTYDANGNTVRECRDHGDPTCTMSHDHLRELFWNEENRLTAVVEGGGRHVTRFLYDSGGDRVVKQGRGGDSITVGQFFSLKGKVAATKHVFIGETRLASKLLPPPGWAEGPKPISPAPPGTILPGCEPSNYQPQKCPYLPGTEPVPYRTTDTVVRPETYYYHSDHLGSTSWVTDQNGKVHEHVEYYPYGEVWREPRYDRDGAGVKGQQFLFTSKELDEETGLYYFGARYYDPKRVRWESTDPAMPSRLQDPRSLALYSYARNNPLYYNDPSGAEEISAEAYRRIAAKPVTQSTIMCHGVSASGFGAIQHIIPLPNGGAYLVRSSADDFAGLTAIPGSGPDARQGYRTLAVAADLAVSLAGPAIAKGALSALRAVATADAAAAFKSGELLERTLATPKGNVGVLAEIEVEGRTLHLKDLTVFGEGSKPLSGLSREMLQARTALVQEARAAGFEKLRISAQRVATSTSANPGKQIDITIDLLGRH